MGAIPAVAIQGGLSVLLAGQQIHATYKGKDYNAPMLTLGIANLTTAGAMMIAGITSGTLLGLGLAAFSSLAFATWGIGHLYLNRFVKRVEKIQKQSRKKGYTPEQIQKELDKDPALKSMLAKFQICYGVADMEAILNAAAYGKDLQAVVANVGQSLMSWESLAPLFFVSVGLSKSFSEAASRKIEAYTPRFLKRFTQTPNAAYSTAYGLTGAGIALKAAFAMATGNKLALTTTLAAKLAAYSSWTHAYIALDEEKPAPESAEEFAKKNGYGISPAMT
ncbi:MAG: hypothetical protein LRZ85_09920 [Alphaproteobacteria bacterium]|nr:hypothetical protein [Alphaproteobacteria bacterium]MCD8525757.1 hypothetical protein [Alphaproteobacteria bacterium]MCD8571136.1 hypothetical protein [Alphaproteobacteria bacterium]